MKAPQAASRLFIGIYPTGVVYADRHQEQNRDYKRLAFLPYKELTLEWSPDVPDELRKRIERHAQTIICRKGQPFDLGACSPIILGE